MDVLHLWPIGGADMSSGDLTGDGYTDHLSGFFDRPVLLKARWDDYPNLPVHCPGDCNVDCAVTIDELQRGVNIALSLQPLALCREMDADRDETISIDELVCAVRRVLDGGCRSCVLPGA